MIEGKALRSIRGISHIFNVLAVLLGTASALCSQTVTIEPIIGYEYGYPLAIERAPGIINHFGTTGSGSSFNHTFGIGIMLAMPDLLFRNLGCLPTLEYRYGHGNFTSDPFLISDAVSSSGQRITTNNEFIVLSDVQSIDLAIPIQFLANNTGFTLGPWGMYELSRNMTGTEYILSGDGVFPGGGTSRKFASGDTIGTGRLHGGLEAGISLKVPVSNSLALVPRLYSRLDLGVTSSTPSKALSVGLAISLAPLREPAEAPKERIDTVPHQPVKSKPAISATIHFTRNGSPIDKNNIVEVTGYSTFFREYTEFFPAINYESGSEDLGANYTRIGRTGAAQFSISSLAHQDLSEFMKQTVNILGYRLQHNPSAHMNLASTFSRSENKEAALGRANALKKYLNDVWMVPSGRISVSASPTRTTPVITMNSSDQNVTAPLATQWVERSYHIPHMGIEKTITAEAGVRRWDISISQNGKELSHFSSSEPGEQSIADFDFLGDATTDMQHIPTPLVATIYLEDFSGQRLEAGDTLVLPPQEELEKNITYREAYLFNFLQHSDTAEGHAHLRELMMQKLFSSIGKGAHITITNSLTASGSDNSSIAERIIENLKLRPDLGAEVHIVQGSRPLNSTDPYENCVTVRIEQAKQ